MKNLQPQSENSEIFINIWHEYVEHVKLAKNQNEYIDIVAFQKKGRKATKKLKYLDLGLPENYGISPVGVPMFWQVW